ncbi:MAG: hypothetical protein HYU69_12320 [Bacteroidetes bacterium]|nr:hypothetical protein [Bacteroidota bacterium]
MKAKTILELLAISTNLYALSKDKELMEDLSALAVKGKNKFDDLVEDIKESNEDGILYRLTHKANQAKEEFELRMEEISERMYKKMHIAHSNEIKELQEQVKELNIALVEVQQKIAFVEQKLDKV